MKSVFELLDKASQPLGLTTSTGAQHLGIPEPPPLLLGQILRAYLGNPLPQSHEGNARSRIASEYKWLRISNVIDLM